MATAARLRTIFPDNSTKSLHVFEPQSVLYYNGTNVLASLENPQGGREFKLAFNTYAAGQIGVIKFPNFVKYVGNTYLKVYMNPATATSGAPPRWTNNWGVYSLLDKAEYQIGSIDRQILYGDMIPYYVLDTCMTEKEKEKALQMAGVAQCQNTIIAAATVNNNDVYDLCLNRYNTEVCPHIPGTTAGAITIGQVATVMSFVGLLPFPWCSVHHGKFMHARKYLPHHYLQNPLEIYLTFAAIATYVQMSVASMEILFDYYDVPSEAEMQKVVYNLPCTLPYSFPYVATYQSGSNNPLTFSISGIRSGECTEFVFYITRNIPHTGLANSGAAVEPKFRGLRCAGIKLTYASQTINLSEDYMADNFNYFDDNVENSYQAIRTYQMKAATSVWNAGAAAAAVPMTLVQGFTSPAAVTGTTADPGTEWVQVKSAPDVGRWYHYKVPQAILSDLLRQNDYVPGTDFNHAVLQLQITTIFDYPSTYNITTAGAATQTGVTEVGYATNQTGVMTTAYDTRGAFAYATGATDFRQTPFMQELPGGQQVTLHWAYKINSIIQFRGPGAGVVLAQ